MNNPNYESCPENCLVCNRSEPEKESEWLDEVYQAQPCRFCSPHCQARFEAEPQNYVEEAHGLRRPLGYS